MKRNWRRIITIVFAIIFIVSISSVIVERSKRQQEKVEIQQLIDTIEYKAKEIQTVEIEIITREYEQASEKQKELTILPEYEELYVENSDLYGWIRIEDTPVDYPVMYTPESPIYYYHRDYKKEESKNGSIFIDGTTIPGESENIIVYGHHMKDGSMFGSLKKYYKDSSYYEQHKYIEFNTIYEKATYEIVAVSKAILYYEDEPEDEYLFYNHIELDTQEEFDDYIKNAKENAYFDTGVTAQYGDQLITLCTCDYWAENARLIIIAKKI